MLSKEMFRNFRSRSIRRYFLYAPLLALFVFPGSAYAWHVNNLVATPSTCGTGTINLSWDTLPYTDEDIALNYYDQYYSDTWRYAWTSFSLQNPLPPGTYHVSIAVVHNDDWDHSTWNSNFKTFTVAPGDNVTYVEAGGWASTNFPYTTNTEFYWLTPDASNQNIISYTLQDNGTTIYSGLANSFSHTGLAAGSSHTYSVAAVVSNNNVGPYSITPVSATAPAASCSSTATVSATSIVCNNESDLPNWGDHSAPTITSTTASNYLASHPNCHAAVGWNFQYALGDVYNWQTDYPNGNTSVAPSPWTTFGSTDSNGVASVQIPTISGNYIDWVRVIPQAGYIPFSDPTTSGDTSNNYSSEFYCATDHVFYDNFESVVPTALLPGNTYYCVAFNAPLSANNFTARVTAIECDLEQYLPDRAGGADITSTTAAEFMADPTNAAHCHYQQGLGIEWGDGTNASVPGGWDTNWHIITGPLGAAYGWYTLGYTNASGVLTGNIPYNPATMTTGDVAMREMLPVQDVPFIGETNVESQPSAEFWCGKDVEAYDNYENGVAYVTPHPTSGSFDCVAFNTPLNHTLTVSISGSGPISSGSGINCPGNCSQSYPNGSTVVLIASPSPGYTFSSWSGACAGQGTTCSVVMDADKTAQANFVLGSSVVCPTLSVSSANINAAGTVTLSWSCSNASSCTAITNSDGFSTGGGTGGSDVVNPSISSGTVTYGMTCGGTDFYFPTISVHSPSVTITASPARIQSGGSTTVAWSTVGATSCTITKNGTVWKTGTSTAGIVDANITTQTVYGITCHTNGADATGSARVNIGASYQQF